MKKPSLVLLVAIVLISIAIPVATNKREATIEIVQARIYLPVIGISKCITSEKKAIAWEGIQWMRGNLDDVYLLCLEDDFLWHVWSPRPNKQFPNAPGTAIPMVWNIAHPSPRRGIVGYWENIPQDYDGFVLVGNECDQATQCNLDPKGTADLLHSVLEWTPNARAIWPLYSPDARPSLYREAYDWFVAGGGDPDSIYATSLHSYPIHVGDLQAQIDKHYSEYMVPTGQGHKPVWITELGWHKCGGDISGLGDWIRIAEDDDRVEYYFLWAPLTLVNHDGPCPYDTFFDTDNIPDSVLAPAGYIVRDALR